MSDATTESPGEDLAERRTRKTLVDRLKQEGPLDAATLAAPLGISAMAVRQHLYVLQDQGLVTHETARRGKGRPAKLWRLTPDADRFFPDGHADLTTALLDAMREAFGEPGLDRLIAVRSAHQEADYGRRVDATKPLAARLAALAALRTEEGYMAAVEPDPDGGFLFIENHCPICAAAAACSGLCRAELELFRRTLGPDVTVERTDHILAGARRCAYTVRPTSDDDT